MAETAYPLAADSIGVAVLNYNSWADTILCLESLLRLVNQPRCIIVCDNGSTDDSLQRLLSWSHGKSHYFELVELIKDMSQLRPLLDRPGPSPTPFAFPEDEVSLSNPKFKLTLLPLSHNMGFSAGNNAALRLLLQDSDCRAFWLLNSDTVVEPDALEWLLRRAKDRPDAGCVGSTLAFWQPQGAVQCAGGASFNRLLGTTAFVGNSLRLEEARTANPDFLEDRLDYIVAASMLVRRECLERTGLLAEEYFLYYEDAEWGIRARKAGFSLAWAPRSVVHHREGGSSGASSRARQRRGKMVDYLSLRNRVFTMRRHYPWSLPLTLLGFAGVLLRRALRGQWDRLGLVARAAWAGLTGDMSWPPRKPIPGMEIPG